MLSLLPITHATFLKTFFLFSNPLLLPTSDRVQDSVQLFVLLKCYYSPTFFLPIGRTEMMSSPPPPRATGAQEADEEEEPQLQEPELELLLEQELLEEQERHH